MNKPKKYDPSGTSQPGENIRRLRSRLKLTLHDLSQRTGLATSTLSRIEQGKASLSYEKLVQISAGLGVDIADVINPSPTVTQPAIVQTPPGVTGRHLIQRAGQGKRIDMKTYSQLYIATGFLNKRITPIMTELRARSLDEFIEEFGDLLRHPGEEYAIVIEGAADFCSEFFAPVRLEVGDSVYFDSGMGHAYLAAASGTCRLLSVSTGTLDVRSLPDASKK